MLATAANAPRRAKPRPRPEEGRSPFSSLGGETPRRPSRGPPRSPSIVYPAFCNWISSLLFLFVSDGLDVIVHVMLPARCPPPKGRRRGAESFRPCSWQERCDLGRRFGAIAPRPRHRGCSRPCCLRNRTMMGPCSPLCSPASRPRPAGHLGGRGVRVHGLRRRGVPPRRRRRRRRLPPLCGRGRAGPRMGQHCPRARTVGPRKCWP